MKTLLVSGVVLFLTAMVMGLVQLWFAPWNPETFLKLEITLGALFLSALAVWFTRMEYKRFRRQQSDFRLDE